MNLIHHVTSSDLPSIIRTNKTAFLPKKKSKHLENPTLSINSSRNSHLCEIYDKCVGIFFCFS